MNLFNTDQLGARFRSQLWGQLLDQLKGQLEVQLDGQLDGQLWGQLLKPLLDQLWKGPLADQLRDECTLSPLP